MFFDNMYLKAYEVDLELDAQRRSLEEKRQQAIAWLGDKWVMKRGPKQLAKEAPKYKLTRPVTDAEDLEELTHS